MKLALLALVAMVLTAQTNQVKNEPLGGTPDGVIQFFTVKHAPIPASVQLYRNGVRQWPGKDFATYPSTKRIGFFACCIPEAGALLLVDYEW